MPDMPGGEPTDADWETHVDGVAARDWAEIWSAHEAVAAEADHVQWDSLGYPIYSPAVERLRTALGALVIPFGWMDWDGVARYRGGRGMGTAPVADAARMITAVLRSERFTDGSIDGALRDGTLPAAIERLRAWSTRRQP